METLVYRKASPPLSNALPGTLNPNALITLSPRAHWLLFPRALVPSSHFLSTRHSGDTLPLRVTASRRHSGQLRRNRCGYYGALVGATSRRQYRVLGIQRRRPGASRWRSG